LATYSDKIPVGVHGEFRAVLIDYFDHRRGASVEIRPQKRRQNFLSGLGQSVDEDSWAPTNRARHRRSVDDIGRRVPGDRAKRSMDQIEIDGAGPFVAMSDQAGPERSGSGRLYDQMVGTGPREIAKFQRPRLEFELRHRAFGRLQDDASGVALGHDHGEFLAVRRDADVLQGRQTSVGFKRRRMAAQGRDA